MSTPADAVAGLRPGEAPTVAPAPRKRSFSRGVREAGLGYLLLLPAFVIFSVVIAPESPGVAWTSSRSTIRRKVTSGRLVS